MAADVKLYLPALLCLAFGSVSAQGLPDPTRPGIIESPTGGEAVDQAAPNSGLQSIIRRKGARPAAVINGELVKLGAKSGDATLVKVGDDYVVLKNSAGTQKLSLTPDIKKTASRRAKRAPSTRKKAEE